MFNAHCNTSTLFLIVEAAREREVMAQEGGERVAQVVDVEAIAAAGEHELVAAGEQELAAAEQLERRAEQLLSVLLHSGRSASTGIQVLYSHLAHVCFFSGSTTRGWCSRSWYMRGSE
jgi:hypothetical protein